MVGLEGNLIPLTLNVLFDLPSPSVGSGSPLNPLLRETANNETGYLIPHQDNVVASPAYETGEAATPVMELM